MKRIPWDWPSASFTALPDDAKNAEAPTVLPEVYKSLRLAADPGVGIDSLHRVPLGPRLFYLKFYI